MAPAPHIVNHLTSVQHHKLYLVLGITLSLRMRSYKRCRSYFHIFIYFMIYDLWGSEAMSFIINHYQPTPVLCQCAMSVAAWCARAGRGPPASPHWRILRISRLEQDAESYLVNITKPLRRPQSHPTSSSHVMGPGEPLVTAQSPDKVLRTQRLAKMTEGQKSQNLPSISNRAHDMTKLMPQISEWVMWTL